MRLAISSVAAGNKGAAISMAGFVRALYEGFQALPMVAELRRDLGKKLEVMRSSLVKIETGENQSKGVVLFSFRKWPESLQFLLWLKAASQHSATRIAL
jgi:predicted translin family RNA/ssDNA-binding protein